MLYVFQVDTGSMLTLHLDLAMESVKVLQKEIGKVYHIPPDKQVLLISGGEILDPNARVCSYSAGTDTNPIYLFSKMSIESATPPSASINYSSDYFLEVLLETDLQELVEGSLNMPPTYETVVARAQLSLQFHDVAKEQLRVCERLVHDQHLQHQGWAAVIANLEDITNAFKARSESFTKNFTDYLANRHDYTAVLEDFPVTIDLLSKIPLLQCLEVTAAETAMMMSIVSITEVDEGTSTSKPKTLLEWISAKDSGNSIEQVVQQCHLSLQQFSPTVHESLTAEVMSLVEAINNPNMKEVKGLEDRLYGLEQLLFGARKKVQEQYEMSQGFVQNQNRVCNLRDASVLPDLCSSHKKQLFVMLKNHQNLQDIHRRCTAAKGELSANLHTRLRWVMFVEKSISDLDNKLMIHHDTLKKLKRKMEIVRQIHSAPNVYAKAVVEVVRRKIFTRYFMEWAGNIAGESKTIHDEELGKRKEFILLFKRHFLRTLFPGFEDSLPAFALETPNAFDTSLPPITSDDIEYLRFEVPELAEELRVPSEDELAHKFSTATIKACSSADVQPKNTQSSPALSSSKDDPSAPDIVVSQPGLASTAVNRGTSGSVEGHSEGLDSGDLDKSVEVISSQCSINIKSTTDEGDDEDEFMSLQPEGLPDPEPPTGADAEAEASYVSQNKRRSQDSLTPAVTTSKSDKTKSSAETSPDLEEVNSDGFTTADFYIDESMPSSMTESPPTKKVLELQQLLYEKNVMLNSKEKALETKNREVADVKEQLEKAEEKFHLLHNIAHKGVLQLKCDVLGIEKQFFGDKDDFTSFMKMTVEKIQTVLKNFESTMKLDREKELDEINKSCEEKLMEYQTKLEMEMGKLADANKEVALHQQNLSDSREQAEKLKEEMENRIVEINKKWAEDLEEIKKNLMLESEVELEKVRSDYELDLSQREQEMELLQSQLEEKEKNIQALMKEKDTVAEDLQNKFQSEKAEITKMLEAMFEERKCNLEKEMEEKLMECRKSELERISRDADEKIMASCDNVKKEMEKEKEMALEKLRTELEERFKEETDKLSGDLNAQKEELTKMQDNHCKELDQQKKEADERLEEQKAEHAKQIEILETEAAKKWDHLKSDHQKDIERLKEEWRIKEEQMQGNTITMERHYDLVKQMKVAWEDEKHEAIKQAEIALQEAHQEAIDKLDEKMMREKSDSLQTMRTSLTAEKQTLFNEALNKVAMEKEKVIANMQERERSLQMENEKLKAKLEEAANEKSVIKGDEEGAVKRVKSTEDHMRGEIEKYKEEIAMLRQQLEQRPTRSDPLNIPSDHSAMGQSFMTQSVMPIAEGSSPAERISVLEQKLKSKESEIVSLQEKLMTMSMSPATRAAVQDKVSITTCTVGDIVLLCLDERHDHYVVFNMGTTLHFLHTDCLETLSLKSRPGEPKKSWVLAEITDKEYCQAKKAQNRFKVPLGTKFFRVKAKPWDRESALQRDQSSTPQPSSSNN